MFLFVLFAYSALAFVSANVGIETNKSKCPSTSDDGIETLLAEFRAMFKKATSMKRERIHSERITLSEELFELGQITAQICHQNVATNAVFGTFLGDVSNLTQKMLAYCPRILAQMEMKEAKYRKPTNGQNARKKEAFFKFGTVVKAFSNELPEGPGKSALIELMNAKQLLPSDLFKLLFNKLSSLVDNNGLIDAKQSLENRIKMPKLPSASSVESAVRLCAGFSAIHLPLFS
uniref:Uncharacterized protein n=1 Tax=Globodera rostochiensis TaxID=31243 RepID=A0A914HZX3_GLORO